MSFTIDEMLNDGFTIKMATYFGNLMKEERDSGLWNKEYIDWAHSKGFLAESASAYNLCDDNISLYLSDYDYYKLFPLNSWERIWVNDKLTLRYLLIGTRFEKYIPKYYYYYDAKKGLIPLVDNYFNGTEVGNFINCLENAQNYTFACKPNNGSGSQGFYKIQLKDGRIFLNDNEYNIDELNSFLNNHQNYIYTEYLTPESSLLRIHDKIHTIRIVVANDKVYEPIIIGGYMRFANETTGFANHMIDNSAFDVDVSIDFETGRFYDGRAVSINKVERISKHPDTREALNGVIPYWNEIVSMVKDFSKEYCLCEYLGFDLCVSTNGIKIMEINTHPGIKHMQLAKPLMSDTNAKKYFESKINDLKMISSFEKEARRKCWR